VGDNIMSWLVERPVQQRASHFERLCGEIASEHSDELRQTVAEMVTLKSLNGILQNRLLGGLLNAMSDAGFPLEQRPSFVALLLRLPWACYRFEPGKNLLRFFRREALIKASSGNGAARGYALEVAVAADRLLDETSPRNRFVFLGSTMIGKDGQPAQEWDVVRLDLDGSKGWSVTAVECAIRRSAAKDDEARAKLQLMQTSLADRFSDLTTFQTVLATVKNGALSYTDAGRSWSKL
jgi:hypothetical protein